MLGVIVIVAQLIALIPFWVLARVRRLQLAFVDDDNQQDRSGKSQTQFGISSMMIGTALLALSLSLLRLAAPREWTLDIGISELAKICVVLAPLAVANLIFITPSVHFAFQDKRGFPRVALIFLPFLVLAAALEIVVIDVFVSVGSEWTAILCLLLAINIAQCGTVYGVIRLLRTLGFQRCTR